jgi:hypothetical protein
MGLHTRRLRLRLIYDTPPLASTWRGRVREAIDHGNHAVCLMPGKQRRRFRGIWDLDHSHNPYREPIGKPSNR